MKQFFARLLCVFLFLQGYPLLALQESGVRAVPVVPPFVDELGGWVESIDIELPDLVFPAWDESMWAGRSLAEGLAVHAPRLILPWLAAVPAHAGEAASELPTAPPSPPRFRETAVDLPPLPPVDELTAKSALEELTLAPGWNLISVPEEPSDTDPPAVLRDIGGAYTHAIAYDACDPADPWKLYDPTDPAASDLAAIDHRVGFWLEATLPVDLPSDGVLPASTSFQLCTGWNLIGFPAGQARPVRNALASIEGKYVRVIGYDAFDAQDPWESYDVDTPDWANDLQIMQPGRGYWVLVTEAVTLQIANEGPAPEVALSVPEDLGVVTSPTDVIGTVTSPILEKWTLSHRAIGEEEWIEIASDVIPVSAGELGIFDPTLLLNGLFELRLEAIDLKGRAVEETTAVVVEGNMKIGLFTLSFVDLAIPLSGLDIEVVRTYDSRDKRRGDFGVGWTLDIRQGSYTNNRPPGDGWQIQTGFLPCDSILESKSHLTTIRLSDHEIYRFALQLRDGAPTLGGCFAETFFTFVDGPQSGTLEVLDGSEVFFANGSDQVVVPDTQELYTPQDVRLTTRDGRVFHLNSHRGVTRLEDLNGNTLDITSKGITHSSGETVDFSRDAQGRIETITDPNGKENHYVYDTNSDLVGMSDREGSTTRFSYASNHLLKDVENGQGIKAVRTEYDAEGRMVRITDASGKTAEFKHDLDAHREVVTNRLGFTRILEYDGLGNVVRETDEIGQVTLRVFDSRGRMLSETDPLSHTTTFEYTIEGDLAKITNALGYSTTYTFDYQGRVLSIEDSLGNLTTNEYDVKGNLVSTTDSLGHTTQFTYTPSGLPASVTSPLGSVYLYEYDDHGYLTRETDPLGNVSALTYDSNGNLLSDTRSRTLTDGTIETLTTLFAYDAMGRQTVATAPDGSQYRTGYDLVGRERSRTDELGRSTEFGYDLSDRLVSVTLPDNSVLSRSYDDEGRLVAETDQAGRELTYSYDPVGRLVAVRERDGAETRRTYDGAGQLVALTDSRGNTTTYMYDAAGRLERIVDPLGQTTEITYDAGGRPITVKDRRGSVTRHSYDSAGNLVKIIFPDSSFQEMAYDALGRQISATDAAGHVSRFGYDSLDRLTSVTDALNQVTSYSYDEVGNRLTQTDANGHTTRFEYDELSRLTARVLPDGSREFMIYNADGTLASHTNFNGTTRTFGYDSLRRLTTRRFSDGSEERITYTPTGRRASMVNTLGTTIFEYDERNRVISKVEPTGDKLTYAYDATGNLARLTTHVGEQSLTTTYTYDELNRLQTVADSENGTYTHIYDANGNLTALTYPNGITTALVWDLLNRLVALTTTNSGGGMVQSFFYTLSSEGLRTRISELDGTSRLYAYDSLHRLVQEQLVDGGGTVLSRRDYLYDPVGNRLRQTVTDAGGGVATVDYAYDSRDRLMNEGNKTYAWDANGNPIRQTPGAAYTWDENNRLAHCVRDDGTEIAILYDADGNRVRKEVTPPGTATKSTSYLTDSRGALSHAVAEINSRGDLETLYVRGGDQLLGLIRPTVRQQRSYHGEAIGSVRTLADETGTATDRYRYTAFGTMLDHEGDDPNPYGYAGEPFDSEIGWAYHRARWMDPRVGRFHGADPWPGSVADPISLHRYLYAGANPVSNLDPTGLFSYADVQMAMLAAANLGARTVPFLMGIYVRTVSALLFVPGAIAFLATWGTRISFGAGILGLVGIGLETLDGWLAQATRNAISTSHLNVPNDNYNRGVYIENNIANVNLGGTVRGIDHYQDETIVQVKSRYYVNTPWLQRGGRLAMDIRTDARRLNNFSFPAGGTDRYGNAVAIPANSLIRQRVLLTYVPESYRITMLNPVVRYRIHRASQAFNVVIRVVPVRGWRGR